MTKVAFICPIYDMKNHFDLAYNLYKSKIDLMIEDDFYFVFSNEEQKEKLTNRIKNDLGVTISSIVLDQNLVDLKSKVVVKKMYALRCLMGKYEYLSIIDSESLFYKKTDFYKLFKEIWNSKNCLVSNFSLDGFQIISKCFKTLGIYDNKKHKKAFSYYRYNFWFNEIPVYKCDTLPGFFDWLDTFDINGWGNEWLCFEYYIYAAYLILEYDFKLKKTQYSSMGGIMEYLYNYPEEQQRKIIDTLGTHWSSNAKITNDNTYLLFHLDRDAETKGYSNHISIKAKMYMYLMMYKTIVTDYFKQLI